MMRAAAFLDRDGTIIVEKHYLSDPDKVVLELHAAEGLRLIAGTGLALVVLSNQSGIGRGKFLLEDAELVNQRVNELLAGKGVGIDGWYMCPHAPGMDCQCRKPLPGLAEAAAADYSLDLQQSFVIGDKRSDVELARSFGGVGILVTTGHGAQDRGWALANGVPVCADLLEAARLVRQILLS